MVFGALLSSALCLLPTGGVAQLGERLLCKQEVIGSIPFTSTSRKTDVRGQMTEEELSFVLCHLKRYLNGEEGY